MQDEQDLAVVTESAWSAFRARLADHVAAMVDDDVLVLEYADALEALGVDDEEAAGAAPYVQLVALGDDLVRLEAVGEHYLDPALALTPAQETTLLALGWDEPGDAEGEENYSDLAPRRDADRVAVLLVRTLREVWAVPHPAFLLAGGLEVDPEALVPDADAEASVDDAGDERGPDLVVAVPRSRQHLQELVDEAMGAVFDDLVHDRDGDIPIRAGRSHVYVRVLPERPAVEIYAEIVLDPVDLDRLDLELGLLNTAHAQWKFVALDDLVVMRHEVLAVPFSGLQLRLLVDRFVDEVDGIAADLVARVGGRRFHDDAPGTPAEPDDAAYDEGDEGDGGDVDDEDDGLPHDDGDVALLGLLELCHLGRPRSATVAGLFEHDRGEIVRQIVRLRTGRHGLDGHDPELVLSALRRALRLVADESERPRPVPPRPRSVQESLLSDDDAGEDTLDLGWPA